MGKIFWILLSIIIIITIITIQQAGMYWDSVSYESINYKDGKFHNQGSNKIKTMNKKMFNSMIDFIVGGSQRVPSFSIPSISLDTYKRPIKNNLRITWLGHSTCLIEIDNKIIITDPMFSNRASPFSFIGPKRFVTDICFKMEDLPNIDVVLISHDHYDHLDYKTIRYLKDKVKQFYVPLGVKKYLENWGVVSENIVELDWWEKNPHSGLTFIAAPTHHFSGRGFRKNRTLWASWVIIGKKQRLYFGGDSGYFDGFKKIGEKYGPFDLTMLESGAYNSAWADIHMMPEKTVQAHIDLNGKILLPIHWAKFNLSLHPWTEPIERVLAEAEIKNVKIITPIQGEAVVLTGDDETYQYKINRWWDRTAND